MNWKRAWKRKKRVMESYSSKTSPRVSSKKISRMKLFSNLALLSFILLLLGTIFAVGVFAWFAKDLPQPDKIVRKEGFSTQIYDRNEKLLYEIYTDQRRTPVAFSEMPEYLREATIAIEDKSFYTHSGFDPRGYLRQIYNIILKHKLQGGSTITQQLVKNVLLSSDRDAARKIKEFVLAIEIERKYSKKEILQMYLNEVPYGATAWGVQSAAEIYFGKKVSELNLVECALLAGLPQSPSYYSPIGSEDKAYIGRTQSVLRRMREDGYISTELEEAAKKELENLTFSTEGATFKAPHFVMYVKKILEDKYGENLVERGGLRVTTSLDLDLQDKAQQIVSDEIAKVEKLNITNGGAMVMNTKTGEILVMVGSKNYNDPNYDGKFNVTTTLRQPGSTIKPVTYVTAFKKGYTAATILMDTSTVFPGGIGQPDYKPVNYDGKFRGPMQVRYALGNSMNIPAVKMLAMVGLKDMLQTAFEMGLSTLEPTPENLSRLGLSVTLGGGEVRLINMVSAYSSFANGGLKVGPVSILKVTDRQGKVLEEFKPTDGQRVLSSEQAYLISNILSDNSARLITFNPNSALNIPDIQVAVKTGTTNEKKDNWTIGWTPSIITGVWVGNNNNTSMKEVASGVTGAAPIWRKILLEAITNKPKEIFQTPAGIVTAEVDTISGYRAHDGFQTRVENFVKETEPQGDDPIHVKLKLCKSSGKLATPIDISRGNYDEKEFFVFKENDPTSNGGENKWQKGIDEWLATQTDSRYRPPSEYCDTQNQIDVPFIDPVDHAQVSNNFRVAVEPVSTNDIKSVEFFVDGNSKAVLTGKPFELNLTLSNGPHKIKARVKDDQNNQGDGEINIGVNVPWDWTPSPTPTPSPTSTPTPTPTLVPTAMPTSP